MTTQLMWLASSATVERSGGLDPIAVVLVLALLTLLPFVLVLTTSFAKISVVLSILRSAIGTPQLPPTMVIMGLSLILSAYVMAPTLQKVYAGLQQQSSQQARHESGAAVVAQLLSPTPSTVLTLVDAAKDPLKDFLMRHTRPSDRMTFVALSAKMADKGTPPAVSNERDWMAVMPAFIVRELTAAFQIGFLLFLPFLVVDLIVANVLMALGMHMLTPTTVSLPFKLLLFVVVDGWQLVTQGLILSYR